MSYILADDILLKVAVVDRLTADASFLAIKSPSIMDLDLTQPAIVISSPDVAMRTPTTVASLDQTMTYSEFLPKPENLDLGSPTLMPSFNEMNIVDSGPMIDSPDEPAEYFRDGYIEEDEPEEYFRPPYIEDKDEDEPIEYFRPPCIEGEDEDESEEFFRPPHIEVNADKEPEAYFRPAPIETDSEKLLRSVENWLDGLHSPVTSRRFPVTPPWRKSTVVEANSRPISLLNEPFCPEREVKREFCPLGDLLGLMTADGWCLGCGAKHLSSGNDGPVFDFAPQLELPAFILSI
jgi:hypothetical protein